MLGEINNKSKQELLLSLQANCNRISTPLFQILPWVTVHRELQEACCAIWRQLADEFSLLNACLVRLQEQAEFKHEKIAITNAAQLLLAMHQPDRTILSKSAQAWKDMQTQSSKQGRRMAGFWTFFFRQILYKHSVQRGLQPWVIHRPTQSISQSWFLPMTMESDELRPLEPSSEDECGLFTASSETFSVLHARLEETQARWEATESA